MLRHKSKHSTDHTNPLTKKPIIWRRKRSIYDRTWLYSAELEWGTSVTGVWRHCLQLISKHEYSFSICDKGSKRSCIPSQERALRMQSACLASLRLEYGKDNYWTSEKMIRQVLDVALPVFRVAFPDFVGVWIFDNSSNHGCFAPNALRVEKLNLGPGGKQPHLRDGFIHGQQASQSMQFPPDYDKPDLAGKPKGMKQILKERGLWPAEGLRLDCRPSDGQSTSCRPEGGCCARKVLAAQRDFREQKGQLREELEARGQVVLFLPKFHCELNPIEDNWYQAKW